LVVHQKFKVCSGHCCLRMPSTEMFLLLCSDFLLSYTPWLAGR
jgi:hypothetical protein